MGIDGQCQVYVVLCFCGVFFFGVFWDDCGGDVVGFGLVQGNIEAAGVPQSA